MNKMGIDTMLNVLLPLLALSVLIGSIPTTCNAESFEYSSDMQVRLGETWNPLDPYTRASVFKCFEPVLPINSPVAREIFYEDFVENFQSLKEKANIKISGSGSTSFGITKLKLDAEYESLKETISNNRSIVYAVAGSRTYEPALIESLAITTEGENLLNGDADNFYRKCGKSIVTSVTYQSNLSVLYIFKTSKSSYREKIMTAISGAVSSGSTKGSVDVNLLSEVKKIDKSAQLEVRVYQDGFRDNSVSVSALIALPPGDIKSVRKKITEIIEKIVFSNSQIIKFSADPVSTYFDVKPISDWKHVSKAYSALDTLKMFADRLIRRYYKLEDLQIDIEKGLLKFKHGMEEEVLKEKNKIISQLDSLVQVAKNCFDINEEICVVEEVPVLSKYLDFVDLDFGEFVGWRAEAGQNWYNRPREQVEAVVDFWPVFIVKNIRLIRYLQLERNGHSQVLINQKQLEEIGNLTEINFKHFWTSNHNFGHYCFSGRWAEDCNPFAGDKKKIMNMTKLNEKNFAYKIVVTDIEGSEKHYNLPNPSEIAY